MTTLCITTEGLPGIRPCTHGGQHRVTCHDHPGWAVNPGTCGGCLPRKAERGYLCQRCYERVEAAYLAWRPFVRLLDETGGRAVAPEAGGVKSAAADGYTNLPLTFLAIDECARYLRSLTGQTIDLWVHTETGARDAILFTHAAEHAYRSLQVEERTPTVVRERCDNCDSITVRGHLTREERGQTIVECEWCGHRLGKFRTSPSWSGSDACEHDGHATCTRLACRCECHDLGRRSTTQGIEVLWDADQHALGWVDRTTWVVYGATVRHEHDERKSA